MFLFRTIMTNRAGINTAVAWVEHHYSTSTRFFAGLAVMSGGFERFSLRAGQSLIYAR
jgi:hypothetical protein